MSLITDDLLRLEAMLAQRRFELNIPSNAFTRLITTRLDRVSRSLVPLLKICLMEEQQPFNASGQQAPLLLD